MPEEAETVNPSAVAAIAEECADLMDQAADLVAGVKGGAYRAPGPGPIGSVGGQVRHLTEFVENFLDGAVVGRVDYDDRARDAQVEADPARAGERLRGLAARLRAQRWPAGPIEIRMDTGQEGWIASTVDRELRFLASHTVHHFAILRLLLEGTDVRLPAEFGIAPSTLRHRRSGRLAVGTTE